MASYQNGINSKNNIIQTARELFYEKGFRNVTYNNIAKAAGVRIGTVSYHFDNLFAIASLIYSEENKALHEQMKDVLGAAYSEFDLAVMEVLVYWNVFFQDEKFRRFHSELQEATAQNADKLNNQFLSSYANFRDKFRAVNSTDADERFNFLIAALTGVDETLTRYVYHHLEELTPEKVFRYSCELYFSIYHFSREELDHMFERSIETVASLHITNDQFRMLICK